MTLDVIVGDLSMSDGLKGEHDTSITVGFLNDRPERLAEYLKVYDVVILGDPDFDVLQSLLWQHILRKEIILENGAI